MNREDYIQKLTEHELRVLLDNPDEQTISLVVDFFAEGGFNTYSDEQLQKAFKLFLAEEEL